MPNFGKVFCFMKFNVNLLELQEVSVFGITMQGITRTHNSGRLQKKAKNTPLPSLFVSTIFQKKRSLLGQLFKDHGGHTLNDNMGTDRVVGPFLPKVIN